MTLKRYDCGFVIALREEFEGIATLGGFRKYFQLREGTSSEYREFAFSDYTGKERSGIACILQEMTPILAYQQTRTLIERHQPTLLLNVGIAGALNTSLRLGDVVVAEAVSLYGYRSKALPSADDGFRLRLSGKTFTTSRNLFEKIQRMWSNEEMLHQQWQKASLERLESAVSPAVRSKLGQYHLGDAKQLIGGVIASGDTVGAAPGFRAQLLEWNRTLIALEMESAGFLLACEECSPAYPRVVLKGISDLADDGKETLERISDDTIRAWAMSNALHVASLVCRNLFDFDAGRFSSSSAPGDPPNDIRDELLSWAVQKHFKKQHKGLERTLPSSLESFDSLFRNIIDHVSTPANQNIFSHFATLIEETASFYPLRINGKPGTGKTTLLTLLYLELYRRSKDGSSAPIPVYLNLKRYTSPERGQEEHWSPDAVIQDDLSRLRQMLSNRQHEFVIILDGIDEYVRYDEQVERDVLAIVEECASAKKVVGIGMNYLADKEKFKRDLGYLNNPAHVITLGSVDLNDEPRARRFIESFQAIYERSIDPEATEQILNRGRQFSLGSLDLLLLSMLSDSLASSRYAHSGTLSDFFTKYCEDFLAQSGRREHETLAEAAKLAFEYTVTPKPVDLSRYVRHRAWKLIHLHPTVKDFLVAYHVISHIRAAGREATDESLRDLDYVYPYSINRFSKDLINSSTESQYEILAGAQQVYQRGAPNAKPHCCYLVGRLSDYNARAQARKWLQECKAQLRSLATKPTPPLTRTDLLLWRTVYISLAYLGDDSSSEEYIRLLLEREEWNDINRGFHLEYYNDLVYEPGLQLSHADTLGPFPKTFESLRERLATHLNQKAYGLFNIEAFTLYSLAQHRHARNSLDPQIRSDLLEFIPQLLKSNNLSRTMRQYLEMLKRNFSSPCFYPGRVAEVVLKLKEQPRTGWAENKAKLNRVESVADHSMGAYLLGLIFLPDDSSGRYNKETVLKTLLVHDLAECITGDVPFAKVTEKTKRKEREAFQYISMCRTYPGIANLEPCYQLWTEFESGATENARIARDLDKLDNLVQLYLYQRKARIPNFDEWKEMLISAIESPEGRQILDIVREHFDSSEAISAAAHCK